MRKIIFLFLFISISVYSQNKDEAEITTVIKTMLDAMRESDSTKLRSVFYKDVRLQTIAKKKTGEVVIHEENINDFIKAVGTPHPEVWNEVIHNYEIKIDGNLATAWTPYSFFLGDKLSHCGVNAFQLMKDKTGWKIISIIDTRRKENCIEKK